MNHLNKIVFVYVYSSYLILLSFSVSHFVIVDLLHAEKTVIIVIPMANKKTTICLVLQSIIKFFLFKMIESYRFGNYACN